MIVLAMLLLLSGLIVAFFNMVSVERTSTAASSNSTTARAIADSTVNMVIGDLYRQKATQETAATVRKEHLQRAAAAFAEALKADDTNDRARAALESTRAETAKIP